MARSIFTHLRLTFLEGGAEPGESPFENFQREVMEEFGLEVERDSIVYARRYKSVRDPGRSTYFSVSKLPSTEIQKIRFGEEGLGYKLMSMRQYLAIDDAYKAFQDRAKDYLASIAESK